MHDEGRDTSTSAGIDPAERAARLARGFVEEALPAKHRKTLAALGVLALLALIATLVRAREP